MTETIEISRCPLCSKPHTYAFEVQRDFVIEMFTASSMSRPEYPRQFRRVFTCPEKAQDFQGTVTLHETATTQIKEVSNPTFVERET